MVTWRPLQRLCLLDAHVLIVMSVVIARHREFAVAFLGEKCTSSGLLRTSMNRLQGASLRFYQNQDRKIFSSFHARSFLAKGSIEVKSSSTDDSVETTMRHDLETQKTVVARNKSHMVVGDEAKPPRWRIRLQHQAGAALSAVAFATSATRALLTDRQLQWQPTVTALGGFLRKTGIDLELSAMLNVRLLDNIIILSRIENAALKGQDRRDLALASKVDVSAIPTNDEALRYV